MLSIKKRKTYEKQIQQIGNARYTIETQILYIEQGEINTEAIRVMELGAQTMQQQQQNMYLLLSSCEGFFGRFHLPFLTRSVSDIDNIMENISEQLEVQRDIADAMSIPLYEEIDDVFFLISYFSLSFLFTHAISGRIRGRT